MTVGEMDWGHLKLDNVLLSNQCSALACCMPNGIAHCPPLEKLWRKLESCFSRIQHLSKVRLISLPYTTLIGLNFRVDNKELTEDLIRVGRSWRAHHINIFCYASDILVQWEEIAWWLKSVKPKTKSFEFWTKSFTSRSEKKQSCKRFRAICWQRLTI